jgi:serine/threonine protein kinase/formylglycine-generating enzyme required for sulfatase activity
MKDDATARIVLLDFLEQYLADSAVGEPRPLETYVARFPGFEDLIREEYARQRSATSPRDSAPSLRAPVGSEGLRDAELMDSLRARFGAAVRYQRGEEIGRGGASRVYRARDVELARELAMKVHQGTRPSALRRFVREARVLGRLDHPGVVPIHELGLDAEGRVYFTMRLVRGQSLKQRFDALSAHPDAARRREALEAVLRVCDTMAYAHSQGVIHRDLKPSNVMLGGFGEVYVVDWGLARAVSRSGEEVSEEEQPAPEPDAPLETLAGDVLGTPAYMPPEQARGAQDEIGARSDVYSVGAILYHLLAGHAPFQDGESTPRSREMLARVLAGPPPKLASLVPDAPAELISICERSMSRDIDRRYPSCSEMAVDLRAYLDGRVVRAHRTSPLRRVRKWVARNRALSAAIAGAIVLGSGALLTWQDARAKEESLSLLADLRGPLELFDEFDTLWPAVPEQRAALEQWLARADALRDRAEGYEQQRRQIRASGVRLDDSAWVAEDYARRQVQRLADARRARAMTNGLLKQAEKEGTEDSFRIAKYRSDIASMDKEILALAAQPKKKESWHFRDSQVQLLHDRLDQFLAELDFVIGRDQARERVRLVRAALTLSDEADPPASPELEAAWSQARQAIEDLPIYGNMQLSRQRGLVPIGPDPHSKLWEFALPQSGEVPHRDEHGELQRDSHTAVVLVLIPGGNCVFGAQRVDSLARNYDPYAERLEGPLLDPSIDTFFLSKYEMTIEQWCRLTGEPREGQLSSSGQPLDGDTMLPMCCASGEWARRALAAYRLELPTSLCWELAARAGTDTPWWCGHVPSQLEGTGNIADVSWLRAYRNSASYDICGPVTFDDCFVGNAPVGSFRPNAYGLHDTIGNVAELCRDKTSPNMNVLLSQGAELYPQYGGLEIVRGGHAGEGAFGARSAARLYVDPEYTAGWLGIRPARRVDP